MLKSQNMPLSHIQETIKREAEKRIQEIEAQAQKQVSEIEAQISIEKENLIKSVEQKAQSKIKNLKEQSKTALEVQERNAILQRKQELLLESQKNVLDALQKLQGIEYEKIISNLLKKVELKDSAEMIVPAGTESESKKALSASGKKFVIKVDSKLKGGFVIKTKSIEINNSFEDIVKQIFEEKEMKIVNLLFEEK